MNTHNNTFTKISIVESTRSWRAQLTQTLHRMRGVQLMNTYCNAEDALPQIVRNQPDLVIIEIELSQMNGIECMMRVLRKAPHISFLVFTTHEHNKCLFAALKGGASGYILKKEGIEGIIEGIKEWKAGGSPMSRSIARRVLKSFQPADQLIQKISTREREILNLLSKGFLYKEIAYKLTPQIHVGTVKQHVHRIYKKLQVNNRTEAINKYLNYV